MSIELYRPTFRSQMRAMLAIARKDWRQYWRYPLNVVSQIVQPLIWLAPIYFMGQTFSINQQTPGFAAYSGTNDYMSFVLIGAILTSFINAVFWGMGYSMKNDMDAGVLESNWLAPVPRPLLMIGRTLTNLLVTALTSLAMLLLAGLLFGFRPTGSLLTAALAILPMLLGLYGFGLAFAAVVLIMREANTLVDTTSFLISVLSGSNFPVTVLPRWLLPISLILPLTYGLDAVRGTLINTRTLLPINLEIGLLVVFMFVMIVVGMWVLSVLERRVRVLGTLGQH
jgi:ABC-2 type transport system permease protein